MESGKVENTPKGQVALDIEVRAAPTLQECAGCQRKTYLEGTNYCHRCRQGRNDTADSNVQATQPRTPARTRFPHVLIRTYG